MTPPRGAAPQAVSSADLPDGFPARLDSLIEAYARTELFSGIVCVSRGKSPLYRRAIGLADRSREIPIGPATRFNICSMGKTFTAVLVMQLVEQGALRLDAPVRAYLAGTKLPNAGKITIHHLLTHTSGLSNYMTHPDFEARRKCLRTLDDVMPLVESMPLAFDTPGERFEYSNSGFIALGKIVEAVAGKPYLDCVRERIWTPLGMTRTSIAYPPSVDPPEDAVPYYALSARSFVDATSQEFPGFSDGGAFSTAADMMVFARAVASGRLLRPETTARMFEGRADLEPGTKYGYGWMVYGDLDGRRFVGHSGGGHGYSADLKIGLDDGTIVLVLANVRTPARAMTRNIIRLLETGACEPPRLSLAAFLFGRMEETGVDGVMNALDKVLEAGGFGQLEGPGPLIGAADGFVELGRFAEALSVLARAMASFPRSPSPHDAAAEVYLRMGKRDEGVRAFRRALDLDPKDSYAAMRLKALAAAR